jgi:cobalt/nickel transport system permease protein
MALDIDRYASVVSPIQRWDPRFKLAGLGFLILAIAMLKTIPMAAAALLIGAVVLAVSALPMHFVSHGLSFILIFLIPFFLILPFSYPGPAAYHVLGLSFAWEGLRLAALIFMKALAIVLITFAAFGSSRFDISMMALRDLKCPKVVVQMLLFTYRYTFVFLDEMGRMYTAMRARGFIERTDRRTLRVFGHFVGTLLVHSFERTERVYKAMLSKGYQGELHSMISFRSQGMDYAKAALILCLAALLLAGDLSGRFAGAERAWF